MASRYRQMEQTSLLAQLEAARRRAKLGQDQIDRQRLVVANLFADGGELEEAENRLRVYQKLHDRYIADVERILFALEAVPSVQWPDVRQAGNLPRPARRVAHQQPRGGAFRVVHRSH